MRESELQSGIEVINSLLEPGSASNDALTEDQREGLNKLKTTLAKETQGGNNILIPSKIYDEEEMAETQRWLLSEFGGIREGESRWNSVKRFVQATSLVNRLREEASRIVPLEIIRLKTSCAPDEWYDLEHETQVQLFNHLKWENLSKWDFDIFEVSKLCGGRPLLFVGWAIFGSPYSQVIMEETAYPHQENMSLEQWHGYDFIETYQIDQKRMIGFLRAIENEYIHDVPYHNNTHGADVLQSTHSMLEVMDGKGQLQASDLQQLCLLVSAAIHDVGHPGFNNDFQMKTFSKPALIYNDKNVLENYHVSLAFRLIMGEDGNSDINIFETMEVDVFLKCRKLIIEAVLATDMSNHFALIKDIKDLHETLLAKEKDLEDEDVSWEVMKFLMHVCDISNSAKQNSIAVQWTDRVLAEFFRQGDKEKAMGLPISLLCDRDTTSRAKSQLGFIDFIIKPTFECMGKYLPQINEEVMPNIEKNYNFWRVELGKEEEDKEEEDKLGGMDKLSISVTA